MSMWESGSCLPTVEQRNKTYTATNAIGTVTWTFTASEYQSQAQRFADYVKKIHRVPQDTETWRKFKVVNVCFSWTGNVFKPVAFDFEDDSSYEGGKVY